MGKPMRFGIIGAGMIANIHADALRRCKSTQLVGVMDNGSGKGKQIAPECDATGADDLRPSSTGMTSTRSLSQAQAAHIWRPDCSLPERENTASPRNRWR